MNTITDPKKFEALEILAVKFGTDKFTHGYIPHYAAHIPDNLFALMEIGCFKGASLLMWDSFYDRRADIHTVDLFRNHDNMTIREARRYGWIAHQGNQADPELLGSIKAKFEVIIDDGSHNSFDQIASWKNLFKNNLRPGGLYVIEDLHCSKEPFYWSGRPEIKSTAETFLGIIEQFKAGKHPTNPFIDVHEMHVLCDMIQSIDFYDDKIAFIRKK